MAAELKTPTKESPSRLIPDFMLKMLFKNKKSTVVPINEIVKLPKLKPAKISKIKENASTRETFIEALSMRISKTTKKAGVKKLSLKFQNAGKTTPSKKTLSKNIT